MHKHRSLLNLLMLCASACCVAASPAMQAGAVSTPGGQPGMVRLAGGVHPLIRFGVDQGAVQDSFQMDHILLQLQRTPAEEAALDRLLTEMQDPASPNYHRWLTAEELGAYGASQQNIDAVVQWLSSHGLQINSVHKNGLTVDFSGNAGQIRETFQTEIHHYLINGRTQVANATNPAVPAAIAPMVSGIVSMNSFLPKPAVVHPKKSFSFPLGQFGEQYDEAPGDFATIYNVSPLYKGKTPITGKGETVVVLEATDVHPKDIATFRTAFGLSKYAGKFSQIHPGPGCTDPGVNGAEGEAALDSEWAGVAAPDANVVLASCADSATNFGPFIAAQNLLDAPKPPSIMSLSYLSCEPANGPAGNAYIASLWQQAALEGVSVFVAAGDNGSAGCDDFNTEGWAISGTAANALSSTPYNVATGGTDFLDTAENTNAMYWAATNTANGTSALSYIPEMPWNDSCASSVLYQYFAAPDPITFCNSFIGQNWLDIIAASGAPSIVYKKPYWQKNVSGVPYDGARDLPDISLFAANGLWSHAILFCMSDKAQGGTPCDYTNPNDTFANSAGGTSFTAPQFAGIQALINQKAGAAQGNPNPIYYTLARAEYGPGGAVRANTCNSLQGADTPSSCLFHDVTVGNNDVPCYGLNSCYGSTATTYGVLSTSKTALKPAFPAHAGWDFATGLGSINVANVVNAWP